MKLRFLQRICYCLIAWMCIAPISAQQLIPYLSGGKYGLADTSGRVVIEPAYQRIYPVEENASLIPVQSNGLWGILDRKGRTILKPCIVLDEKPTSGLLGVRMSHVFYAYESTDQRQFAFARLYKISDTYARVDYYINPSAPLDAYEPFVDADKVRPVNYNVRGQGEMRTGLVRVGTRDGKINMIDTMGRAVFQAGVYDGYAVSRDVIAVCREEGGPFALFHRDQRQLSEYIYTSVNMQHDDAFLVASRRDTAQGQRMIRTFYAFDGTIVKKNVVTNHDIWSDKLIIEAGDRTLLFGTRGDSLVFPFAGLRHTGFDTTIYYAREKNQWGIITRNGDIVVAPRYTSIEHVSPDKCFFRDGRRGGLLNAEYTELWSLDSLNQLTQLNDHTGYYHATVLRRGYRYRHGVVDSTGEFSIAPHYKNLSYQKETGAFYVESDSTRGLVALNGDTVRAFVRIERGNADADQQTPARPGRPSVKMMKNGNTYGLVDANGQFVTASDYAAMYERVEYKTGRIIFVGEKNSEPDRSAEIFDKDGRPILPDGYGVFNGTWGAALSDHASIIVFHLDEVRAYGKGIRSGTISPYRSGVIDFDGNWLIQPDYQIIQLIADELFRTVHFQTRAMGLYDRNGLPFGDREYLWVNTNLSASYILNNRLIVGNPQDPKAYKAVLEKLTKATSMEAAQRLVETELPQIRKGCLDMTGKLVIPLKYDEIDVFHHIYTTARITDKKGEQHWVVIDTSGNELLRASWDKMGIMYGDTTLLWIEKDGLKGVIDMTGKVIVPPVYQSVVTERKVDFIVVQDAEHTYVLNRDDPEQKTEIGPAGNCEVHVFYSGQAQCSIGEIRGKEIFTSTHLFDKRGNHLGDFSNAQISNTFYHRPLPLGFISVKEPGSDLPFILSLNTRVRYKD